MPQPARILVIPSWYPSAQNPMFGHFIQEQSVLLQQRYDIRVLFGISHPVGFISAIRQHHWFPKRGRAKVLSTNMYPTYAPPPVMFFEFAHRSVDEIALVAVTIDAYSQMFRKLISEGWMPDIIHAHNVHFPGIIAAELSKEFRIPFVITEHRVFALGNYPEYTRKLIVDALHGATKLVAVSYHQLRVIAIHNIYRTIDVVGNLVDDDVFQFVAPSPERKQFHILTVTYPSPIKDCETFFHALEILLKRGHTDIAVTVIGNNAFRDPTKATTDEYQRLAAKYGVEQVCKFIPFVARSEMPGYYADCDAFVSTSIAETFGTAVREAMMVGRPAVCTASGGVDDDLSDVNGVKVNIGDYESIANALIAVKTGRLNFDAAKVRQSVVNKIGRQAFLDKMTAVYEDVLLANK